MAQSGYPPPTDKYVNDYAGVLALDEEAQLRSLLSGLERDSGVEATLLTVTSIHDYETGDDSLESFATHLFNAWGIGSAETNDGLLILLAVEDRQVRIELGSGYGRTLDRAVQRVIDEQMLPHLRQADYAQGLLVGVQAVVVLVTDPQERSADHTVGNPRDAWLALLVGLLGGGLIVGAAYRYARRSGGGGDGSERHNRSYNRDPWHGGGSSRGGDMFGGGSSSGGGASGEW